MRQENAASRYSSDRAIFSMALDIVLTFLALFLAVRLATFIPPHLTNLRGPAIVLPIIYFIVPILWGISFLVLSAYDPKQISSSISELRTVAIATLLALLLLAGVLFLTQPDFSRWVFVIFATLDFFFLLTWRIVARAIFRLGKAPAAEQRVLIVGVNEASLRVSQLIQEYQLVGLNIIGYLADTPTDAPAGGPLPVPILGSLVQVRESVLDNNINDVVIALPQERTVQINDFVIALHNLPVNVWIVPDYFSLTLYRASVEDFGGLLMINLSAPTLNSVQRTVKRLFDIIISLNLILIALIPIGVITLIVKLDSKGPAFFQQERIGENGRTFRMFKFRTMIVGADRMVDDVAEVADDGKIVFKKADDPRVTRIGHFLRRTSLDELPQLFNVLKGEMSLVGPRPELPWLVEQYQPWQLKRLSVPQGMTGWWQINGRADKPSHVHTEDDLFYIQNYSLWMDIYILLKTPWAVVRGKGAY